MTFGDEIQAPAPKRRKAGKKGKAAEQEEDTAGAGDPNPSGSGALASGVASATELPGSEPAELSRTGAAEVVADADATIPSSQGGQSHANS